MKMKLTTDDFSTVERLAKTGELQSVKIDWIKSLLYWSMFYTAIVNFK